MFTPGRNCVTMVSGRCKCPTKMDFLRLLTQCFNSEASFFVWSSLVLLAILKVVSDTNARMTAAKIIKSNNCMIINPYFVNKKCTPALQPAESSMVIEKAYLHAYPGYVCLFSVCANNYNQEETIAGDYCCRKNVKEEMSWIRNLCDIRSTRAGNESRMIAMRFYRNFYATIYHNKTFGEVSSSKQVKRCCKKEESFEKLLLCLILAKKSIFTSLKSVHQLYQATDHEGWGQSDEVIWAVI